VCQVAKGRTPGAADSYGNMVGAPIKSVSGALQSREVGVAGKRTPCESQGQHSVM